MEIAIIYGEETYFVGNGTLKKKHRMGQSGEKSQRILRTCKA